jgi:hypothetical protein
MPLRSKSIGRPDDDDDDESIATEMNELLRDEREGKI